MNRVEKIREQLQAALSPTFLEVVDDAAEHEGHLPRGGPGHFTVKIASEQFKGKSVVACHQLVYRALADMMQQDIHALRIHCVASHSRGYS